MKGDDMKLTTEELIAVINDEMVPVGPGDWRVVKGICGIPMPAFKALGRLWTTKSAIAKWKADVDAARTQKAVAARDRQNERKNREYRERQAALGRTVKTRKRAFA